MMCLRAARGFGHYRVIPEGALWYLKNYESKVGSSSYHCSSFLLIILGVKLSKLENPVPDHRCIGE